jgi:hypothetical protein
MIWYCPNLIPFPEEFDCWNNFPLIKNWQQTYKRKNIDYISIKYYAKKHKINQPSVRYYSVNLDWKMRELVGVVGIAYLLLMDLHLVRY